MVFLFDADDTLLDNDRIMADLNAYLVRVVGPERAQSYWKIFDALWKRVGYPDYFGTLQVISNGKPVRAEFNRGLELFHRVSLCRPRLSKRTGRHRAGNALGYRNDLSDGDAVFQP